MLFKSKVVLVTGGARGIGREIAMRFGKAGAVVIVADVNRESGSIVAEEISGQGHAAKYLNVDLSDTGAPQRMVQEVVSLFGRLDILVNNARSGSRVAINDDTEENWDRTFAVSLRAAAFASRSAIAAMSVNGGGCVVNISSISATQVSTESWAYQAAKAGLLNITKVLAVDAGAVGVRVNAVLPGFIVQDEHWSRFSSVENTRYRTSAERVHPLKRVGRSADVADAVLYLSSDASHFITGQALVVDGGLTLSDNWSVYSKLGL